MCQVICRNNITTTDPSSLRSLHFAEAKAMQMVLGIAPSAWSEKAALIFAEGHHAIQRRGRPARILANSLESMRHVITNRTKIAVEHLRLALYFGHIPVAQI